MDEKEKSKKQRNTERKIDIWFAFMQLQLFLLFILVILIGSREARIMEMFNQVGGILDQIYAAFSQLVQ